jgi:hypothetical protein
LIPLFFLAVPFPSVRCRIRTASIKEEFFFFFFLLPSRFLLFRVRLLPLDLMKRCQTEKSFRCIVCIVYSTEYFDVFLTSSVARRGRVEWGMEDQDYRLNRKKTWWYLITRSIRLTLAQQLPVDGAKNSSAFHWLASFSWW